MAWIAGTIDTIASRVVTSHAWRGETSTWPMHCSLNAVVRCGT